MRKLSWTIPKEITGPEDGVVIVGAKYEKVGQDQTEIGWKETSWLVVRNMIFMTFHVLGIIIPTDFHIFQRGWNHQLAR